MGTLSATLRELGFFLATGSTERIGGSSELVGRSFPMSTDYNNGVRAVYDEHGDVWIMMSDDITDEIKSALSSFEFEAGNCHVPHSNDGGKFVRDVLVRKSRL